VPATARATAGSADAPIVRCNPPAPPPLPPASDFVPQVDNPYFPLAPGTTFLYRGQEDNEPETDVVNVTHQTKTILGIQATVVADLVTQNGAPTEFTNDWYAQDNVGNVWYLGEQVFDFVNGHWVPASDSWESGVDGAQPGIIMEAHPAAGDVYAQEHYPGHAMDMAKTATTDDTRTVPYGTFDHVLKSWECTPLEPLVRDLKYYAPKVGEIQEATVTGGSANLVLVSVTHD
jgi:hypothetical protein